jgi:predicted GIY-YIG superfamily endonuclease
MAHVYILFSALRKRTYVGCSENWQARLETHNAGRVTATRSGVPWRMVHLEEAESMLLARRRESYLKSSAGRRWTKRILKNLTDA